MPQPIPCPLCSATFATIADPSVDSWENLAGIRLVKHLAVDHKLGPRGAWLAARDTLCLAGERDGMQTIGEVVDAEREREREQPEWQPDDVVGLTENGMGWN